MNFFRFWLTRNSRTPFSAKTLLFFALFVGITRGMLEQLLFGIETYGSDILAYVPFYFSLPFVYSALLTIVPGIRYEQSLQPVTFATLLGLLPPVFDFLLGGGGTHGVFYGYYIAHDYVHFPWFGYAPARNYPLGEAITIWLSFLLIMFFIYKRTQRFSHALIGLPVAYAAYLCYSLVLPGLTSLCFLGFIGDEKLLSQQNSATLRPVLFILSASQVMSAWFIDFLFHGASRIYFKRILHFLPFCFLTLLGAAISRADVRGIEIAVLVTGVTGIGVIAHNDLLNLRQEKRPENYTVDLVNIAVVTVYIMILFSGYKLALFGLASFSLSVLYHYKFFNIRRTLFGSMKVEGLWGVFSLLTGVFAAQVKHPNTKVIALAGMIFAGFSLFSILKDAKDLREDHKEGRRTLYTLLFRKKIRIGKIHKWASGIYFSLLVGAGVAYFTPHWGFLGLHCGLAALSVPIIWKIHRKLFFQVFMFIVSALIMNLTFFERGS